MYIYTVCYLYVICMLSVCYLYLYGQRSIFHYIVPSHQILRGVLSFFKFWETMFAFLVYSILF